MMKMLKGSFIATLMVLFAGVALAQTAPTVTIKATPTSGLAPLDVVVSWASTGAATCVASGSWSGTKALSGSQTFAGVSTNRAYTLTCSTEGKATVTWTPPTQNTDGSAITNLASYELFHAATSAAVSTATAISVPLGTTHVVTGLPNGIRYFGMKAVNDQGVKSNMSALANKTISILSASGVANVTITVKPNPPVIVTIAQAVYDLRNGQPYRYVGTIPLNTPCMGSQPVYLKYWQVDRSKVRLTRTPRSTRVVAKCAMA